MPHALKHVAPVLLATLFASPLAAQQATIESLGWVNNSRRASLGMGVSGDGTTLVGHSMASAAGPLDPPYRGFRWTRAGGLQELDSPDSQIGAVLNAYAYGCSWDGAVIVGYTEVDAPGDRACLWTAEGCQELGALAQDTPSSYARDVSADGSVVVGFSTAAGSASYDRHAFRWTAADGMQDLGTIGLATGESEAHGISADGTTTVGASITPSLRTHAFRVTGLGALEDLGTIGNVPGNSAAHDVSADGRVVVGTSQNSDSSSAAFIWTPSTGMQALPAVGDFEVAKGVNSDGSVVVGYGAYFGGDGARIWIKGVGYSLRDLLTSYGVDLTGWDSLDEISGCSADGKVLTGRGSYSGFTAAFRVELRNRPPTATAMQAQTVECVAQQHLVSLSTTVDDPDGELLTVTWTVNGQVQKTQSDVAPGTVVSFDFAYPHGVHAVNVSISDGSDVGSVGTTVTVQDTTAPIVIVAAGVVVPTDPGRAYATNVVLTPPTASDASGHAVTLSSDARSIYPLGVTVVTWTATDEDGNHATATQTVTVHDREKPKIAPLRAVRTYCDPAKLFATVKLTKPAATDNAPGVKVSTKTGNRFPIGTTNVVWTAKDAAGNKATWTQKVTVVNRKPTANAGDDVTKATTSEKGAKVTLDGSRSSDPDKHQLKFRWSAPKVKLTGATSAKPSGVFPVGRTTVTLTVTDAGGLKHKDILTVTVKLANGTPRPRGADANRSFAYAARHAGNAASNGRSGDAALASFALANLASAYGNSAGEFVRWDEGQSEDDALIAYADLRAVQATYGQAAQQALLSAYAESGDESLISAYGYTVYGTAYAAADLSER